MISTIHLRDFLHMICRKCKQSMRKRLSGNDLSNVASIETKLDQGAYYICMYGCNGYNGTYLHTYILSYIIDVFIMKDERWRTRPVIIS